MQHDYFFLIRSIISFICGVDVAVVVVVVGGFIKKPLIDHIRILRIGLELA